MCIRDRPNALRRSGTFDNGSEFALHHRLAIQCHLKTYFCDPHAPWQKSGIENAIGRSSQPYGPRIAPVTPGWLVRTHQWKPCMKGIANISLELAKRVFHLRRSIDSCAPSYASRRSDSDSKRCTAAHGLVRLTDGPSAGETLPTRNRATREPCAGNPRRRFRGPA